MTAGATPRFAAPSDDTVIRAMAVVVGAGIAGAPFYRPAATRELLLGVHVTAGQATLTVLCLGLALAWWSTQPRSYLWADPAWLTWADFGAPPGHTGWRGDPGSGSRSSGLGRAERMVGSGRERVIARRLVSGWVGRWGVLAYVLAVSGVLLGWAEMAVGTALFLAVGAFSLVAARTRPVKGEGVLPLALAAGGAAVSLGGITPIVLWGFAALAVAGTVGLVGRESLAVATGRSDLVARFAVRLTRRMSVDFLDVWGLLPPGKPLRPRRFLDGRLIVLRYLLAGVLVRGRSAVGGLLVGVVVVALHGVFPAVPSQWLLGLGAYLVVVPFAAPIAQLHRTPSLTRWFNHRRATFRLTAVVVLTVVAAVWSAVIVVFGLGFSVGALAVPPLVAAAAVRSVTRAPLDFANLGVVDIGGVLVPSGLIAQLARGPEALLIGLALLGSGPAGVALALGVAVVATLA
ncbi:hypothetical protein V5P93_004450 [Actinokineospora auranticolor]|uniref:Uncharacterized protein n=1 Tax=Actinokineospora auranticolor TaxID=155976 RepID=A0A2S6GTD3_9PSEU|nr:hypothetical protein [Actinokineospora auranticolor]PPK68443.1 hypothetical protein CLV40_105166 [Actinokineospora auranticolor]